MEERDIERGFRMELLFKHFSGKSIVRCKMRVCVLKRYEERKNKESEIQCSVK